MTFRDRRKPGGLGMIRLVRSAVNRYAKNSGGQYQQVNAEEPPKEDKTIDQNLKRFYEAAFRVPDSKESRKDVNTLVREFMEAEHFGPGIHFRVPSAVIAFADSFERRNVSSRQFQRSRESSHRPSFAQMR